MEFKKRTLLQIADMICGNYKIEDSYFIYRSSSQLTEFFYDANTDFTHDGSTRNRWVADVLQSILKEPHPQQYMPPDAFSRVIQNLMEQADAFNEDNNRANALQLLNNELSREGFEAFYAPDNKCYLKHIGTQTVAMSAINPHRAFSELELKKKEVLSAYLNQCSEDELITNIIEPLFRHLGFHRITVIGHRDKALEYGKDIWMKYTLPTQHVLYFGVQAKKGKIDSAGVSKGANANVAEIHNQALMMLGHEIFDPEIGKKVLVDHAFIIAGGEITKAAKNWIGGQLDATKRSQLIFMDRDHIIDLFIVANIPVLVETNQTSISREITPDNLPW